MFLLQYQELNTTLQIGIVLCFVAQLCPNFCDPMDCSPPGSSVHGDSPGKNTGVGCHVRLQRIFPNQGLNTGTPHCRQTLYHLSHRESQHMIIFSNWELILEEIQRITCKGRDWKKRYKFRLWCGNFNKIVCHICTLSFCVLGIYFTTYVSCYDFTCLSH